MGNVDLQEIIDAFADAVADRIIARTQPPPQPVTDEWLTPKEAAAICRCSWQRLETLRRTGGGPVFRKEGRLVRYARADVLAYLAAKMKRRNTITATKSQRSNENDS